MWNYWKIVGWVQTILQDSGGLMWFGTGDGLNRYDGYQIKIYKYDPENSESLSHSVVSQIYENRSGNLWIGTDGGGLNRLARGSGTFSSYQAGSGNNSLSNNHVTAN
jgi:ligand-binding sensor domain-containing protein